MGISRNYTGRLDPTVLASVQKAFRDLYVCLGLKYPNDDSKGYEEDVPRLALHDVIESAEGHLVNLRNYVVLYGFLRSMTLLVVVTGWAATAHSAWYAGCHAAESWGKALQV